ncbi:Na/Pi-cotransporter II-related protein [Phocaeicola salanitronis DSM 18170]|jgi:phosphate:Na+ symporter|uniref:Na/Pi-cotransporter II-related protein n=1 Tax=Phocaeicola salanitronis (strain DSM 18170 / JCM 13657 / CCUG 60908 / BL78) TaxID=667015 RepID=F0R2A2_PHOSB|nr:Na/Pi cotransporter family protein [Phocaeicola salanitronis]ADY36431.1 Na/Pi-cotransporter II-related protein [Phocaeicola salanitronis DSM 18170]
MEYSFYDFLALLGSLALFLYGMKIMSEGLQKFAGDRLRNILTAMTTNRVTGVLTGTLITALVQSSSATTVMVVSFVNAGLLTLSQSISVIMGANIGTTVTAWIISALGFKVDISVFALPLLAFGVPLLFSQKSSRKSIGEFIFGFSFLFMGLDLLKKNAPDLSQNPDMLAFVQNYTDMGFFSVILFVLIGTVLTMIVQASSATMAITLIMCANGWISFELGAALVLGENIGTTITANLAALTANTQARRAALAHLMFNVFGVMWVLILFKPFLSMVDWIIDDWMQVSNAGGVAVSFKLSAFHTCFNVCNVLILIWFVKLIERTVCRLIPQKETEEEYRLQFISGGMLSTAELSLLQARKEINLFAERIQRMFGMVRNLLHTTNENEFNKLFARIEKYEGISDNMEVEIATYLTQVSEGRLSSESKLEIREMLREVSEIESIGDSCYNLARTMSHKRRANVEFTDEQYGHIEQMFQLTDTALTQMIALIEDTHHAVDVNRSFNLEHEINNYRDQLKDRNVVDINEKAYNYQTGVHYMDLIAECEKLGDYVVNVVEAHTETKEKKA